VAHGETKITADLVRGLLRDQHPDLADRPVRLGARGWDNQLWRLGSDLAVRLPWATQRADTLLRKEHAWVPMLAPLLPLAAFLSALHRPAPAGAPSGEGSGGPLAELRDPADALTEAADLGLIPDPDAVRAVWDDALTAPAWEGPPTWLHGDLHPANVLTADGTFCGVIDFGDMCAGDPACDLAASWILLPDGCIDRFHETYQPIPDAATLRRARGWAVLKALAGIFIGDAGVRGRPGGKTQLGSARPGCAAPSHRNRRAVRRAAACPNAVSGAG
jgi:aminoglycoside phosphotransferase (APT) family kinase protein